MHNSRPSLSPWIILAIGVVAISTASLFIRYAQSEVPSLAISAWRMTFASLLFIPGLIRNRLELRRLAAADRWRIAGAGLFLAAHFASWITSLQFTSIASSAVLVTTTPLWTALLSGLVLGEPVRRATWIGLGVAIIGGILVAMQNVCFVQGIWSGCSFSAGEGGSQFLGNILALLGAWMATGYMLVGRLVRPRVSTETYTGSVYLTAAAALMFGAGLTRVPLSGFSPGAWVWLLLLALIPQAVGHTAFNHCLRYLPAVLVTLAVLAEPIGASLLGLFFLREVPGLLEIGGAIIILAGILLAVLPGIRRGEVRGNNPG